MSRLPALADPRHKARVGKCRVLAPPVLRAWPTEKTESFPDAEPGGPVNPFDTCNPIIIRGEGRNLGV